MKRDNGIVAFFILNAILLLLPGFLYGQPLSIPGDEIYIEENTRSGVEEVRLPNRQGGFEQFEMLRSDVFEADFNRAFPQLKSYKVFSKSSHIFGRILKGSRGIYAYLFDGKGYYAIERGPKGDYLLSDRIHRDQQDVFRCDVADSEREPGSSLADLSVNFRGPEELRIFRLAIASAAEFTNGNFGQGSTSMVQEIIVSRVMALNVMYENEMSIHFNLINNNQQLTYFDADTDGFDPDDRTASAHAVINGQLGSAAYDIGQVFYEIPDNDFGSSGVAFLYALCNDNTKGGGWTGVGGFASFYTFMGTFAHEVGHQCGAHHSYYGTDNYCESRSPGHGFEPGSGNSLMSYEGSCSSHNIYPEVSTHFFHLHTLLEIETHLGNISCGTSIATGNTAPIVSAPDDKIIPRGTPFELTGTATDAEDDMLYYDWEQYDTDDLDLIFPAGHPDNADVSTTAPLFRTWDPRPDGNYRSFPKLSDILNNTQTIGEILPQVARDIHLRLVARDKHAGDLGNSQTGGAFAYDETVLTVEENAGPFRITSQNNVTEWVSDGSNTFNLTWDVANTTQAPISCTEVDILFSIDGGKTFPFVLASQSPNDGNETLVIPAVNTYNGRIKIKAANNYFFDINNETIEISSECGADGTTFISDAEINEITGSPNLDLDLSPLYGDPINDFTGSITENDPPANFIYRDNTDCQQSGNNTYYDVYTFYVQQEGSYTFTKMSGAFTLIMNVFQDDYNPLDPCATWLASSAHKVQATGLISISQALTVPDLKPGIPYYLVVTGFSASDPVYPAPYSIDPNTTVYSYLPDPGMDFNYTYVTVDESTGNIVTIDPESDLSGYLPGEYTLYGLSYETSTLPDPSVYHNTSFEDFQNDLLTQVFCGNLSLNSKKVNIEGVSCEITDSGLEVLDCDDNGTPMMPDDDTFGIILNPTGSDVSATYGLSGSIVQSGLNFDESISLNNVLPADGDLYPVRIFDEVNGCFLDIEIQAPEYCSTDCSLDESNVEIMGCSDEFSITITPEGINLTENYHLTGDVSLNGLTYGSPVLVGEAFNAAAGAVNFTIEDDVHNCTLEIDVDGPATKPEITNLDIVASDCTDDTGSLTAEVSGGVTPYQYDLGTGFQDNPDFQNLAPESYTLLVEDALGCQIESMVIIPSEDGPVVELGDDQDICLGEDLELDAGDDGVMFQWTFNGENISGATESTFTANETGSYGVTATNEFDCSTTDFMVLTVHDPPDVNLGGNVEACEGDEVMIGDPTSTDNFNWTLNGMSLTDHSNVITVNEAGIYIATVISEFGCSSSDEVTLSYLPKPEVDLGDDIVACSGDVVELDAGVSEADFSFIWTLDGDQISTSKKILAIDAGLYELTAYNAACSATSSVQVDFNEYPDVSIGPNQFEICLGDEVTLEGNVSSGTISWSLDGVIIPGETDPDITVSEAGSYTLEANNQGCISSESTEVIVHPLPEIDVDEEIRLCPGEMTDYFPGTFSNYEWHDGSQEDHLSLINDLNSPQESSESYAVTVTDENGCVNSDEGTVIYLPILQGNIQADNTAICPGESVQLNGTGGDLYEWTDIDGSLSATDVADPVASPAQTTEYTLVVSETACPNNTDTLDIVITVFPEAEVSAGVDSCIFIGQSIELQASGGSSYEWTDPNDYLSSVFGQNPVATPLETTLFSVEITDENDCKYTDEVEICVIKDPDFAIPATSIITPNDDGKNDALRFEGLESFGDNQIKIFTRWGDEIFSASNYQKTGPLWDGTKFGEPLPAGVYFYVLNFGEFTIKSSVTLVR